MNNNDINNKASEEEADNPVVILDGYEDTTKRMNDFASYYDENGEQWCSIKEAVKITGRSDATIRRYLKNGDIRYKKEFSPYGEMYVLLQKDVEMIAEAETMKMMKRDSGKRDITLEIRRIIESYESSALIPIKEQLDELTDAQSTLQESIVQKNEQLKNIDNQHQQLLEAMEELKKTINEQQDKIDEQQQYIDAQKSKGFWGRLFGKN